MQSPGTMVKKQVDVYSRRPLRPPFRLVESVGIGVTSSAIPFIECQHLGFHVTQLDQGPSLLHACSEIVHDHIRDSLASP